ISIQTVGVFLMNKEKKVVVPVDFKQKDIYMISFVQFYLTVAACKQSVKVECEETLQVTKQLKEEHRMAVNGAARNNHDLLSFVKPNIIRLNEGKHLTVVAEEPMSLPSSPSQI
ncbi:hypothetical protein EDC94DRAFT_510717, partial [Helicostylum pulchrum]